MRIGIVGIGALGGLFAGHLAKTDGAEVVGFDIDEGLVDTLNEDGLRVTGISEFETDIDATTDFDRLDEVDGIMVAVKSIHTESLVENIADKVGDTPVFTIQNGLGNAEIIAEHVDAPVMNGATFMGALLVEPGVIEETNHAGSWVGPHRGDIETAQRFADAFAPTDLDFDAIEHVPNAVWTKLLVNAAVNPVAALTRKKLGSLLADERTEQLLFDIAREGERVAEAKGIEPVHDPVELIEMGRNNADETEPSMLQDIQHGRQTEIEFLNGAIVDAAAETDTACPLNESMTALVSRLAAEE
jgi:2-dehydropantoate 2-reductase